MEIKIIAAVSENGVIGNGDGLPWDIPSEMNHFVNATNGNIVVFGRNTWDGMGRRTLSNRKIMVVTREKSILSQYSSVFFLDLFELSVLCLYMENGKVNSQNKRLVDRYQKWVGDFNCPTCFIAGGSQIYDYALPMANSFLITIIKGNYEGTHFFPQWKKIKPLLIKSKKLYKNKQYTIWELKR